MSNQLISVLGGALMVIGAAVVGVQACSSSSSGNGASGNTALCNQGCDKAGTCLADAGAVGQSIVAQCKDSCNKPSNQNCTNQAEISTKVQECLAVDCSTYIQCLQGVPDCQGGSSTATGSAGSSGTATGTTTTTTGAGGSTGGSGPGATCDVCTKSDACCVAIGGTADQCTDAASCNSATGQNRDDVIQGCMFLLQAAASDPNAPAACK